MKKIIALMLSLCLLMMSGAVLAETATVVNWADMEEAASSVEATMVPLEGSGLQIWIPNGMNFVAPSEEEKANGIQGAFASEDGSSVVIEAAVLKEGASLADFVEAAMTGSEFSDGEYMTLNGLNAYSCKRVAEVEGVSVGSMIAVVEPFAGTVMVFHVSPVNDETSAVGAYTIISSIQPVAK